MFNLYGWSGSLKMGNLTDKIRLRERGVALPSLNTIDQTSEKKKPTQSGFELLSTYLSTW